jgi:hypothetical protein
MLDARVVVRNPFLDPIVPYVEELLITYPERTCSHDKTKVELDCTKGVAGKRDHAIRIPFDDGEMGYDKVGYM